MTVHRGHCRVPASRESLGSCPRPSVDPPRNNGTQGTPLCRVPTHTSRAWHRGHVSATGIGLRGHGLGAPHARQKDEEIVEVYNQGDIQEVSKDRVHESLEGRCGIGEAEWHDEEFEGAVTCAEGCFPLIPVFNA